MYTGGTAWGRTRDAQLFRLPLYRLSYGTKTGGRTRTRTETPQTGLAGFRDRCLAVQPPFHKDFPRGLDLHHHRICHTYDRQQQPAWDGDTYWRRREDSNPGVPLRTASRFQRDPLPLRHTSENWRPRPESNRGQSALQAPTRAITRGQSAARWPESSRHRPLRLGLRRLEREVLPKRGHKLKLP